MRGILFRVALLAYKKCVFGKTKTIHLTSFLFFYLIFKFCMEGEGEGEGRL